MAIGFVEMQGQITRAQDFTMIKHNEDTRPAVEQANVVEQQHKQIERQVKRVNHADQSEYHNKKFDAKDKGSNEYHGDGGKYRRNHGNDADGKVLRKGVGNFDISL